MRADHFIFYQKLIAILQKHTGNSFRHRYGYSTYNEYTNRSAEIDKEIEELTADYKLKQKGYLL